MRVLHTSDWHLGNELHGKKRYKEFQSFLNWMLDILTHYKIDYLLIAGDIFDTVMPKNEIQRMYYEFLSHVHKNTPCRHIIITSGNHDSASLIDAPEQLLKICNETHVVGRARANPDDEVFILNAPDGHPELIVCAAPFLHERDVRATYAHERIDEAQDAKRDGIAKRYRKQAEYAQQLRQIIGNDIPIIAMGHLYVSGSTCTGSERPIVGNLCGVDSNVFSPVFDYVALGHIHHAQDVSNHPKVRYSGAPIPLGFDEAKTQKSLTLLEFSPHNRTPEISTIPVPVFQRLETLEGNSLKIIREKIRDLSALPPAPCEMQQPDDLSLPIWIQIRYTGDQFISNLGEQLKQDIETQKNIDCLCITSSVLTQKYLSLSSDVSISDLDEIDVFRKMLEDKNIPIEQRKSLETAFLTLLEQVQSGDDHAM